MVVSYVSGISFNNGIFYVVIVMFDVLQYNFGSNFQICFQCDVSVNVD